MVEIDPKRVPSTPKNAATVIVLRDADPFEVFMVKRHAKSGFMAGAFVFPGGKLDDADADERLRARASGRTLAECAVALGESDAAQSMALFFAAIRETFEEAGVLLARGHLDESERKALHDGDVSLLELAERADLTFQLEAMVPQARWITPTVEPRRYDTRFFLTRVPPDQQASHDAIETTEGAWMTPSRALDREQAGEIQLPPPTLRTLEWLLEHGSIAAALTAAAERPPPVIQPVFQNVEGVFTLALPGDPLHPVDTPVFEGVTRFVLENGRWFSRKA